MRDCPLESRGHDRVPKNEPCRSPIRASRSCRRAAEAMSFFTIPVCAPVAGKHASRPFSSEHSVCDYESSPPGISSRRVAHRFTAEYIQTRRGCPILFAYVAKRVGDGIITAPQVQGSLQHSARNPKQETIAEPTLQKAKGGTRQSNYSRHRAITAVMSSCCSLPLLNFRTAPTIAWRSGSTGR